MNTRHLSCMPYFCLHYIPVEQQKKLLVGSLAVAAPPFLLRYGENKSLLCPICLCLLCTEELERGLWSH